MSPGGSPHVLLLVAARSTGRLLRYLVDLYRSCEPTELPLAAPVCLEALRLGPEGGHH